MRIAIAEDENAYAEKLKEYLRQYAQDYGQALETACYSDGVSFLDSFRGQFDLILLDISMPLMDGMETARRIRTTDPDVVILFVTEVMRNSGQALPKHVFYEDNLMVCRTLPDVQRLVYQNIDLYRYWIGRPDQSVQQSIMSKRYHHQILVTEKCFTGFHLDSVCPRQLRRYMQHELFMMFGISILFTRLNRTAESDAALNSMWETCFAFDPKWARHFRRHTPLCLLCLPGTFGQRFSRLIYRLANKVVRFNGEITEGDSICNRSCTGGRIS